MKEKSILKELKQFLILWSTQSVSALGTAMTEYALLVWVYEQEKTASSVTLLTICIFAPTILFRFLAGTFADRGDKKRIMLAADIFAACGTAVILLLHSFSVLRIWHLYVISALLSLMNAFQQPASYVATSLLVPKEHYTRVGGLQGLSGALVSITAPALGAALLAFSGVKAVLWADLFSFFIAVTALLCFIRIPKTASETKSGKEPILKTVMAGFSYLRGHGIILRLVLFMTCVNFLAKLGNDGMLAPFVLGRTGGDQRILGAVQSFVSLGVIAGSTLATWIRPPKNKPRFIFIATAIVFSGCVVQSLSARSWVWYAAAVYSYAAAALMNAVMTGFMRERIPSELQGRVFSAQSTLENCSIPLGLYLGGILNDRVFEPFMGKDSAVRDLLVPLFGTGKGSGTALVFFIAGSLGIVLCVTFLVKRYHVGSET